MEMETDYKWIVYLTTNKVNGKIYVGVHKTKDPYVFDGYIGCGIFITQPNTYEHPKTSFQFAVKKYGVKSFIRQTLYICATSEKAYALESDIVNADFLKRDDVYNMIPGGEYITPPAVKVFQYDLKGKYMCEYNSMQEAADKNGVTLGAIDYAVGRKIKECNSYWSTDKSEQIDLTLYNNGNNHRTSVFIYTDGVYTRQCHSQTEAANVLNTTVAFIHSAVLFGCTICGKHNVSYIKAYSFDAANTEYISKRKVYQYSKEGKYLAEYVQSDAQKKFPKSNIQKCIKRKIFDCYGYMWAVIKVPDYNTREGRSNRSKKVGKYTLDGELVKIYNSATQAAKENGTSVWKVLSGMNKTHKQHIYKYIK